MRALVRPSNRTAPPTLVASCALGKYASARSSVDASQPLCARHAAPECHDCKFDYKALGRAIVMTANPKVTTAKLSA